MPSLRAICMGLILSPLLQLSGAAPVAPATDCHKPRTAPALPTTGCNPTELPLPGASLTLIYVAIGRGVQNYTCASPSTPAIAIGAIATLYDATSLAYRSTKALHAIPPVAVTLPPAPPSPLSLANAILQPLGTHYFDPHGTPVFDLPTGNRTLFATKAANVPAPADASTGPGGLGAVDWLYLTAKPTYPSVGLSAVYRVVTAGGKAACTEAGPLSVQYAAEYWFYGEVSGE